MLLESHALGVPCSWSPMLLESNAVKARLEQLAEHYFFELLIPIDYSKRGSKLLFTECYIQQPIELTGCLKEE
jgi:hypothetical protein